MKDEKKSSPAERYSAETSRFSRSRLIILGVVVVIVIVAIGLATSRSTIAVEQVPINFSTEEIDDEAAVVGESKIVAPGSNGIKEVVTIQRTIFGITISSNVVNTTTVKEPTQAKVKRGIIRVTEDRQSERVPYGKEVVQGGPGLTEVTQRGVDGTRTKVYEVRTLRGKELSRKLISNQITQSPIAQITTLGKTTCIDVTTYDYNWQNDMLCTNPDGSKFYTDYAGADAATR